MTWMFLTAFIIFVSVQYAHSMKPNLRQISTKDWGQTEEDQLIALVSRDAEALFKPPFTVQDLAFRVEETMEWVIIFRDNSTTLFWARIWRTEEGVVGLAQLGTALAGDETTFKDQVINSLPEIVPTTAASPPGPETPIPENTKGLSWQCFRDATKYVALFCCCWSTDLTEPPKPSEK